MTFAHPLIVSAAARRGEKLARLVYEPLDAHYDTEHLVRARGTEREWRAHLDYLGSLQRRGRGVLAEHEHAGAPAGEEVPHHPDISLTPKPASGRRERTYDDD
jgi:hypothetical protein